jgi:pimeloyl-ACP methyl ester carboxylesterase
VANYRRTIELAPQASYVLVENGSHMMPLDRPDAIVDAVRTVVKKAS